MKPVLLVAVVSLLPTIALAQGTARALQNAPIYLRAEVTSTPLRVAAAGTVFKVLETQGDWVQVEFQDPSFGRRVGWVETKLVEVSKADLAPMDLSVRDGASATPGPASSLPPRPPVSPQTRVAPLEFRDAKLAIPDGDKSKEVDVVAQFGGAGLQLVSNNKQQTYKTLNYAECKSAEYSYSKSPRWKSGLFISPFLFLSSGKKHWFMVKTANDYALLHLDKSNYKLFLAEFETRTGLKVEAQGENK